MRLFPLIAGAGMLALMATAGCGGGSGGTQTATVRAAVGRSVPAKATLTGFNVTVQTDKASYKVGDPIKITVSATNSGQAARTLKYPTPFSYHRWGYIIAQNDKIVTYEYWDGHGQGFPAAIGSDTYASGETKSFTYDFPYPTPGGNTGGLEKLPEGTYQVYARMPELVYSDNWQDIRHLDPTPASLPVTITIAK
jgi:hypothetical protein